MKAVQSSQSNLEDMIILMYQKGVTTRDISELIEKMYGQYYAPATISNLSSSFEKELQAYRQRKIQAEYIALYCDATFIPVRRDTVSKEALHMVVGIDAQGHKEILDFQLFPNESSENYKEILKDLKQRGLQNVLLFVSDELTGLTDAVTDEFPKALHQTCWTHLLRSVSCKVRAEDRQAVLSALKKVPKANTFKEAGERLSQFNDDWGGLYPKIVHSLKQKKNLFSFMHFPHEVALEKTVYCYVAEYNAKYSQRIHRGFGQVHFELERLLSLNIPVNEATLTKEDVDVQAS